MNATLYDMMLSSFKPYLIGIIVGIVIVIAILLVLLDETKKTNQILSSFTNQQDNYEE